MESCKHLVHLRKIHQGDTKATISIADELGKLAKLKEQGAITEESLIFYE
jgi:hypothetical protein